MEVFIVARVNSRMKDSELLAINGIQYGLKHHYAPGPLTPEIAEELMIEFEKYNPEKCSWIITAEKVLMS